MIAGVCDWSTGVDIRGLFGLALALFPQALGLNFLPWLAVPDTNTPKILSIQG